MLSRTPLSRLTGTVLVFAALQAAAQDAQQWLDRMTRAVEELNYQGTFVHLLGDEVEALQIVHINDGGRISERIVSMDGVGREIIRHGDQVRCIFPDRRIVLLEERRDVSPLVSALPSYSEGLQSHYEFALLSSERVVERETQVVAIHPRDEFRYGYILWLDSETAMPLKSQLRDEQGRTVEQMAFTRIEISGDIPLSALEPTIDAEGFRMIRPPEETAQTEEALRWRASRLPSGFRLSVATQTRMAGSDYPVEHLVYSDGLAAISVFIENPNSETEVAKGFSRVGSANAYSLSLGGRQVTAVGEVPMRTVETIATSFSGP